MKKMLVNVFSIITLVSIFIISSRGLIFPVENILGCYDLQEKTYIDRVCLYSNGQYEQFYIAPNLPPVKYNSSSWRSFPYDNDLGHFVAGSLNEFILVDDRGEFLSYINLDIQPYKDLFGAVLFIRGVNSLGEFNEYYRNTNSI